LYELKNKNKSNYLVMAWKSINPSIQILLYFVVFVTLRKRSLVEVNGMDIPSVIWLLAGFFLWIFSFLSMIKGSKLIYSRLRILSIMSFPFSVIPNFVIFSKLYVHLFMLGITIIILQFTGFYISIHYIQLIYFLFSAIALLFAISLITSTISTIIRDF